MRFDTPIYMQKITSGKYDPDTGDYADDTVEEACVYADISSTGINMQNLVYGQIRQASLTVVLQNHYTEPFSKIRIGKRLYRVDFMRRLRTKHIFIVSEVQ